MRVKGRVRGHHEQMREMVTKAQDESVQYRGHGEVMKDRLKVCEDIRRLRKYRLRGVSEE